MEQDIPKKLAELYEAKNRFDEVLSAAIASGNFDYAAKQRQELEAKITCLEGIVDPFGLLSRQRLAEKFHLSFVDEFASGGVARARGFDGYWSYINRQGDSIGKYFFAEQFSCGWALARKDKFGAVSFINLQGNELRLPYRDAMARSFSEGYAAVCPYGKNWYFLDTNGHIRPNQFLDVGDFSEGLAWVKKGETALKSVYNLINTKGEDVSEELLADYVEPMSEGYSVVKSTGRYGFIDKERRLPYFDDFDFAESFSEGIAVVAELGYYFFINKSGESATGKYYQEARSFKHGLAPVKEGGLWRFINKSGERAFEGEYDEAESYSGGVAKVLKGSRVFYIDTKGRRVFG